MWLPAISSRVYAAFLPQAPLVPSLPLLAPSLPLQVMSALQQAVDRIPRRPGPKDWSPRTGECLCKKART